MDRWQFFYFLIKGLLWLIIFLFIILSNKIYFALDLLVELLNY